MKRFATHMAWNELTCFRRDKKCRAKSLVGEAVDCLIELGAIDLSSSAYVSNAARAPDFQALGGVRVEM